MDAAQLPATEAAKRNAQQDRAGDERERAGARALHGTLQSLWHRLVQHAVVARAQLFGDAPIGLDALCIVRMRREPCRDRAAPLFRQVAVGIRLQVCFGYGFAHFTTFSLAGAPCPSIIARSFSRARESRDITVPIGMPSVRATSS